MVRREMGSTQPGAMAGAGNPADAMSFGIDPDAISATGVTITPHLRRTPVVVADGAEWGFSGARLVLKLELFQHTGSFKPRGAFANLLRRPVPDAGVVAASGGNHGAAVAYAAHRLGIDATIFVPEIASPAKRERIRGYGAHLVVSGQVYSDALEESRSFSAETGALEIHAYDQVETLLGQGTVAEELESQMPDIDTLLVAVGGGGLIGGIASWYRSRVRVVGVEPYGAPTLARALEAGKPVDVPVSGIAADSLGATRVGTLAFEVAKHHVDRVVLVDDDQIRRAQSDLWERLRIVAEPGGAAPWAALLAGGYRPGPGETVAVLVCGGNTDAVVFEDR